MSRPNRNRGNNQNADWAGAAKIIAIALALIVLSGYGYQVFIRFWDWQIQTSPTPINTRSAPPVSPTSSPNAGNLSPVNDISEAEAKAVIEDFIDAWISKDLDRRFSYLSQDFTSTNFDVCKGIPNKEYGEPPVADLTTYKQRAIINAKERAYIEVDRLTPFQYIKEPDGVQITYTQLYKHPGYSSQGINKFYLRMNANSKIEIYKEIFLREECSGIACDRQC